MTDWGWQGATKRVCDACGSVFFSRGKACTECGSWWTHVWR